MDDADDAREFGLALAAARAVGEAGVAGLAVGGLLAMAVAGLAFLAWHRWAGAGPLAVHELTPWKLLARFGLAFAVVVAAAAGFAELAEELREGPDLLGRIDDAYAGALRAAIGPWVRPVYGVLTHFADTLTLATLTVLGTLFLWWRGARLLAIGSALAMGGQALLILALKSLFERVRPLHAGEPLAAGWSFPSGHTLGATVFYGLVAYAVFRLAPRGWHLPTALVAPLLVWNIGISRVVLGMHHPSDVAAGFTVGTVWLVAVALAFEGVRWHHGRRAAAA